jgi:hypothetical protein
LCAYGDDAWRFTELKAVWRNRIQGMVYWGVLRAAVYMAEETSGQEEYIQKPT